MHKISEASDAFSSWCFFDLNEVAFLSCLLFVHQIPHVLEFFFALNGTKSPYTFVNTHSVINWSPKEGN